MAYSYQYPRPGLTVDTAIVAQPSSATDVPKLLLIKRKHDPFAGQWALPGGFVDEGEDLVTAAGRELLEETSVDPSSIPMFQVGAFGEPGRDPRGWTVTVAYAALVPSTALGVKAADDAAEAEWFDVGQLPPLAFDHKIVVRTCLRALAEKPEVAAVDGVTTALRKAADKLEGPWKQG